MKEAANGSSLNNGPFNSPFPKRSFHINKIIWLILLFSLGLNVVHLNGGQLAVLQQSIYESSTIKEDVILRMGASSSGEPPSDDQTFDPIRFIAVAGLYHTGSTVRSLLPAKSVFQIFPPDVIYLFRICGIQSMPILQMG